MAFCANCGRAIADSAEYCPNCGHPQARAAPAPGAEVAGMRLAGFWMRFLALLIDFLIIGVVGLFFPEQRDVFGRRADGIRYDVGFGRPITTLLYFAYSWLMIGLNDGRTVGCLATGLRVARSDGARLGMGAAAGRQAMAIVSSIPLALGYLWAAWDPQKRTWHDMVASSRVFKLRA